MAKKFTQLTEETTTADDDIVAITDTSAGASRKVQLQNLLPAGVVTTAKMADDAITDAKRPRLLSTIVYRNTNYSLANNAFTAIPFDNESIDAEGWHDNVTNNTRITVDEAGLYAINTNIAFANNSTGIRGIRIHVNGSIPTEFASSNWQTINAHVTQNPTISGSTTLVLAASDYVEVLGFQDSGAALNVVMANFSVTKLSD